MALRPTTTDKCRKKLIPITRIMCTSFLPRRCSITFLGRPDCFSLRCHCRFRTQRMVEPVEGATETFLIHANSNKFERVHSTRRNDAALPRHFQDEKSVEKAIGAGGVPSFTKPFLTASQRSIQSKNNKYAYRKSHPSPSLIAKAATLLECVFFFSLSKYLTATEAAGNFVHSVHDIYVVTMAATQMCAHKKRNVEPTTTTTTAQL